ncbi:unnamed protein product [Discula destructiva]
MAPAEMLDVDVDMEQHDAMNDEAEKVINEEYKTWKKNSPFLYDMILSTALEWPTLTTQWFPDVKEPAGKNHAVHRLLYGTHTSSGTDNYIQIAEVEIPKSSEPNANDYDEDRGEIGGYGRESLAMRLNVVQKIDHPSEVNKARYQPQNPDMIAAWCIDGRVLVYNRTKHSSTPTGTSNPDIELLGHEKEGFGLNWSPHDAGILVSGGEDATVRLWDLNTMNDKKVKPSRTFTHHHRVVNDVQYHPVSKHFIGTVSDDLTLQILDTRQAENHRAALVVRGGHSDALNALAFNPASEFLIATASGDKTIGIWDIRSTKEKVHTLEGHMDAVTTLSWHPKEASILGSASYDRRVIFWDLARIGEEQTPEDAEDGPPELLFMHGGHTNHLADFSWNPNDPWVVASAGEDNVLQIWKPSESIVGFDSAEMPIEELDRQ